MADRFMPTDSWRSRRPDSFMDGGAARIGMAAAALVGALGLGFAGYSLLGHGPRAVPVVEADPRPIRIRPDNPGGLQLAGAEEQATGGTAVTAPPPEAPAPQALRAKIRAESQPARAPVQPVSAVVALPPAAAPIAIPAEPVAARPPPAAAAKSAGMMVQLAALTSEPAAMAEWQRLSQRMPSLLATHHPAIERIDRDGRVLFRLRTGGFADAAAAAAFCAQVHAKGTGCDPARS